MKQIIFLKKHKFNQLCLKLKELNIDIKEGNYEIGCCLDLEEKILYPLNVTCMCCFFNKNTKPLLDEEVLTYFDELIMFRNDKLLKKLYKKANKNTYRPIN